MSKEDVVAVDFETEAIHARPHYPPRPVGVAIADAQGARYLAWGHPLGNTCSYDDARRALALVFGSKRPVVFHNAKFDLDVAETHMGLEPPPLERVHDTVYLAFLDDPLQRSLALGDLASKYLRAKAWKAGKLEEWILANVPEARRAQKSWGAHISKAPGDLVAVRATGDARNTRRLFAKLDRAIEKRGMSEAYLRERRLMHPLLEAERAGVRVDLARLDRDVEKFYLPLLEEVDRMLRRALKAPELDVDKPREVFAALERSGKLTNPVLTNKGNPSISKEALEESVDDKRLVTLLTLRGVLATCLRTFALPWRAVARETGGLIHTQWNQTRQPEGGGARTGRLSSTPNFQNILNPERIRALLDRVEKYHGERFGAWRLRQFGQPRARGEWHLALPLVPQLRDYIVPDKGHVLLVRDYSQQELRILAHFENGALLDAYKHDPRLDVHNFARDLIHQIVGVLFDRRPVKDTGFGMIYGLGIAGLAKKIDQPYDVAQQLQRAYKKAIPGIGELTAVMRQRAAADEPIRTWGGREYFCEPPAVIHGRLRTFEYKLINVLIQGSAADNTKEALARYAEAKPEQHGARFLMTVHDETVVTAPREHAREAMAQLRETMESVEFDVPMLSDGKWGPTWARLKKFND